MLNRLRIVLLAFCIGMASAPSYAAERIELTTDDVTSMWRNINNIVLVLSANIAMDDEWVQELRDMSPDTGLSADADGVAQQMGLFHGKLNALLTDSDLKTIPARDDSAPADPSTLYIRSGTMLDNLVTYLITADTLASAAIYYADAGLNATTTKDLVTEVNLANKRMDAFMEENGL